MMGMVVVSADAKKKVKTAVFPDGSPIPAWFSDTAKVDVATLGKQYVVTDYGVKTDSTVVQTRRCRPSSTALRKRAGEWWSFLAELS